VTASRDTFRVKDLAPCERETVAAMELAESLNFDATCGEWLVVLDIQVNWLDVDIPVEQVA
jgi:hypothetical protein